MIMTHSEEAMNICATSHSNLFNSCSDISFKTTNDATMGKHLGIPKGDSSSGNQECLYKI